MSVSVTEVQTVWKEADCLWTAQQVEESIARIAQTISADLGDKNPLVLVVMKGGMVFGGRLLMQLQFPLELEYVHVSRYGSGLSGGADMLWKVAPPPSLAKRHVLVVDDILDEGVTLSAIMQACASQGAKSVKSVVLVDKQHDRKADADFRADYTCLEIPDRYIFGYGMDYKGYLRNADGIFAVKGQ
ncbi:MAG: hypoxanthine-guanine phosphoribosyltransferase [Gammaproteobacteria bacterium]|nr:hypoxanthine-guanine phosphoribosyltransferase [Gammaproteobacteria bacterium]